MLLYADRAQLRLADDEVVHLTDALDSRLEVTAGHVWITIEGDRGDVVIGPGESFLVDSAEVVTVSALRGDAELRVRARAGRGDAARATRFVERPGRLRQFLARVALSPVAVG